MTTEQQAAQTHVTREGFNVIYTVSIKHGLRTADYGLQTEYKIWTRYKTRTADCGLGIKYGLRTTLVKTVLIGSR